MSSFLPEGGVTPGASQLTPANAQVSDADVSLMQRVLAAAAQRPNMIPDTFMGYVLDYIQANNLTIPISQIVGFSQFVAQIDTVDTEESISASVYSDLSTVGPQLVNIAAGAYLVLAGAYATNDTGGNDSYMSVKFNAVTPVDYSARTGHNDGRTSISLVTLTTLTDSTNTIKAMYRASGTSAGTFGKRWLVALKYANA